MTSQPYEYRVLHWPGPMTKKELDDIGAHGWLLIAVHSHTIRLWHYFARPLKTTDPQVGTHTPTGADPRGPT